MPRGERLRRLGAAPELEIERFEWIPATSDSALVRLHGRWADEEPSGAIHLIIEGGAGPREIGRASCRERV